MQYTVTIRCFLPQKLTLLYSVGVMALMWPGRWRHISGDCHINGDCVTSMMTVTSMVTVSHQWWLCHINGDCVTSMATVSHQWRLCHINGDCVTSIVSRQLWLCHINCDCVTSMVTVLHQWWLCHVNGDYVTSMVTVSRQWWLCHINGDCVTSMVTVSRMQWRDLKTASSDSKQFLFYISDVCFGYVTISPVQWHCMYSRCWCATSMKGNEKSYMSNRHFCIKVNYHVQCWAMVVRCVLYFHIGQITSMDGE